MRLYTSCRLVSGHRHQSCLTHAYLFPQLALPEIDAKDAACFRTGHDDRPDGHGAFGEVEMLVHRIVVEQVRVLGQQDQGIAIDEHIARIESRPFSEFVQFVVHGQIESVHAVMQQTEQ